MPTLQPLRYELRDCRAAHGAIYDVEVHDGEDWRPYGKIALSPDTVTHDGEHIADIDYHGPNHALLLRGKESDASFRARLNLTECGTAFVGTVSVGDDAPRAIRGVDPEIVFTTERQLDGDTHAPFHPWDTFTIRSAWREGELKITYLLGTRDVSNRVRVTKVDRPKGETTLEMVPEFNPPFDADAFCIVLPSGNRSFSGTLTDLDNTGYQWRGSLQAEHAATRVAVFDADYASRPVSRTAVRPQATRSLQDLDNISSIQVVTAPDGKQITVDYAQTTCGRYFNECLVNGLDKKWIDGIYGNPYVLKPGVQQVFDAQKSFFQDNSVLGTGQMLYDNLATNPTYKDLIKRIDNPAMKAGWETFGTSDTVGVTYQKVSSELYIQGYRDGVTQMAAYLDDDPVNWAKRYFDWLTDTANLITWQTQVASKQFDNVKTRMYEWYVKLRVLAPEADYGDRFTTIAYAALMGVNYAKSEWADDLKPYLTALIENAISGKVDPSVMDEVQRRAAEANQEALATLITSADQIALLVDGIAAALSAYSVKKTLQQLAGDPAAQALIAQQLAGPQLKAWNELTAKGKITGLLGMLFYGASAGFLIYTLVQDAQQPQTPKQIISEVNVGVFALAIMVKGVEKLMSLGVGRYLTAFSQGGHGGAFRAFAGDLALWFSEGGKVVPVGKVGKAFVAIFGESSAEFMARRMGPALAVCGVVMSAYMLYQAIMSGDVRSIVFEALNAFFALASLVLIGFELMSFAWAGPAGLAIAAIGVIVVLVQFIWGLIDPPKPPPDPITEFVDGPMVAQRFARPALVAVA